MLSSNRRKPENIHKQKAMEKAGIKVPILLPPATIDKVQQKPDIPGDQQEKLDQLRDLSPWSNVPTGDAEVEKSLQSDPLHHSLGSFEDLPSAAQSLSDSVWVQHFREFCSDACLLRYLRANNWNVEAADRALTYTLKWRRAYQPHLICAEEVEAEAVWGKQYQNGFTKDGSPIIYFRNHLDKSKNYKLAIRFLIFSVENAIKSMPDGVEKITLIFDFQHFSPANASPMNVSRYFLHIFSSHYPERMKHVFAVDPPWYFWAFYKVISPFINPVTKSKFRFVKRKGMHSIKEDDEHPNSSNLLNHIEANNLESDFGGEFDFVYDPQIYWAHMRELSEM